MPPWRCWAACTTRWPPSAPRTSRRRPLGGGQALGEAPRGLPGGEPDGLGVDVGVGGALAHRLERGDRPVELLAGLGVLGGQAQGLLADADGDAAQRGGGPLDHPLEDLGPAASPSASPAAHRRGRGGWRAGPRWCPGASWVTPAPARSTRYEADRPRPCGRGPGVRSACGAGARRLRRRRASPGRRRRGRRRPAGRCRARSRRRGEHAAAVGDAGSSACRCASVPNSAIGSAASTGGEVRDRRGRAADLLEDEAGLEEAEAAAAVVLGHRDAEQAGLGERRPEPGRVRLARASCAFRASLVDLVLEDLRGEVREACCSSLNEKSMRAVCPPGSELTSGRPGACRGRTWRSGRAAPRSCRRRR